MDALSRACLRIDKRLIIKNLKTKLSVQMERSEFYLTLGNGLNLLAFGNRWTFSFTFGGSSQYHKFAT